MRIQFCFISSLQHSERLTLKTIAMPTKRFAGKTVARARTCGRNLDQAARELK